MPGSSSKSKSKSAAYEQRKYEERQNAEELNRLHQRQKAERDNAEELNKLHQRQKAERDELERRQASARKTASKGGRNRRMRRTRRH